MKNKLELIKNIIAEKQYIQIGNDKLVISYSGKFHLVNDYTEDAIEVSNEYVLKNISLI